MADKAIIALLRAVRIPSKVANAFLWPILALCLLQFAIDSPDLSAIYWATVTAWWFNMLIDIYLTTHDRKALK